MTKKSFKKADPNYQKELAKYGNPIPSRDYILQIIRENNAPDESGRNSDRTFN